MSAPAREPRVPAIRIALGVAVIAGLTALGVWWSTPSWSALAAALRRVVELPPVSIGALVALIAAYVGAEAVRLIVVGRLVGASVTGHAALDAAIAGHFFTALAPGAVLGEGAAGFTLARHGVATDAAVLIPTLKLATSFVVAYLLAVTLVASGFGPPAGGWLLATSVAMATVAALVGLTLLALARQPAWVRARVGRLEVWARGAGGWRQRAVAGVAYGLDRAAARLAHLGRAGTRGVVMLLAIHALYYAVYVAPLVILCPDAPPGLILVRGHLLLCLLFLAPTPGGAGVGEASAVWFLGDVVPPVDAVAIVATYRLCTSHVHVAIGAIWVPVASWRRRRANSVRSSP